MRNGTYAVTFQTALGLGTGVVFLDNGVVRGGDSMMYYVGNYTVESDMFSADVTSNTHAKPPGMQSVFGRDSVHITLKGSFSGQDAKLSGTAKEAPGVSFNAALKWISA